MDLKRNPDVPYLTSTLLRHSLLEELQAADQHRLILVSAPPGYGKTTLIAQFAHHSPLAVAWLTLTERERDLPNLQWHAVHALEQVIPDIHELKHMPHQPTPHDLAVNIAYFLRDHLEEDIFFVLDDVHYLIGSLAAEQWLYALVEAMPARCHLIIISRVLPDLPLVEMISRREILAFGQEKLCFSPAEIDGLAQQMGNKSLPKTQIDALEGWPAGVVLSLHPPLPAEVQESLHGKGPEALFNVLASSMLSFQLPDIRNFLLASSVLTQVTPEVCSKALGIPNSHELLASVLNQHLFASRATGGIIYHQLFRDFLQNTLKRTSRDQFSRLHLSAARWFQNNEQLETAFTHYLAADAPE
ncbi:MAG: AAA family ATPase, partial [Anaerolineae bacterium]|nr:AAA family ATPase [Anaerolineae bacterium]